MWYHHTKMVKGTHTKMYGYQRVLRIWHFPTMKNAIQLKIPSLQKPFHKNTKFKQQLQIKHDTGYLEINSQETCSRL